MNVSPNTIALVGISPMEDVERTISFRPQTDPEYAFLDSMVGREVFVEKDEEDNRIYHFTLRRPKPVKEENPSVESRRGRSRKPKSVGASAKNTG
tara:strand:+ start:3766 stop:4050 length:285 start_codon:yes stop_codon:yes gene_type:complete